MGTIDDMKSSLTQSALDALCKKFHIPFTVHPELHSRNQKIRDSPTGKIGVYTRFFDFANYRIPLSQFFVDILKYFQINLSQLSVIATVKISHFEILCRVHGFVLSVGNFRRYYELDDNAYSVFLDNDDGDMDLFAFINHADPTKTTTLLVMPSARTAGKSLVVFQDFLDSSTLAMEVGVMAAVTVPFVTSSVTPTPEQESGGRTDSIFGPNLRTRHPTERFVISSDSSHHSSTNSADDEVTSIVGTEPAHHSLFRDLSSPSTAGADIAGPSQPAGAEFNVGVARHACFIAEIRLRSELNYRERKKFERKCNRQADLLKEKDNEIVNLEAQLSLKKAEAAEAIRLCSQVAAIEDMEAARVNELNSLKERTTTLEGQVMAIESVAIIKDTELAAALESEKDKLTDQVSLLETICFGLRDQGMQDGLTACIDHGKAERGLVDVAAYNHSTESNYVSAVNAFRVMDFLLFAQLRIRGDVASQSLSISDVMVPLIEPLSAKNLVGKVSTSGIPTTVAATTALSTTFVQAYSVPPVPASDYEVVDTKP
nr:putative transposase (putative), gypsy type [Tanacetum cinerariifolium]